MAKTLNWCDESVDGCPLHDVMRQLEDAWIIVDTNFKTGIGLTAALAIGGTGWLVAVWANGQFWHLPDSVTNPAGAFLGYAAAAVPAYLYKDAIWKRTPSKRRISLWMKDVKRPCTDRPCDASLIERGHKLARELVEKPNSKGSDATQGALRPGMAG
jgi:hypothetical protein